MNTALLRQSIRAASKPSFSRSGGPGGQNVNKVNTKVTLRLQLDDVEGLDDNEYVRLKETLSSRISGAGELIITASEERSQRTNLERAYIRMEALIINAARIPRQRRPTKPSRAAKEERLRSKRLRGKIKAARRYKQEET